MARGKQQDGFSVRTKDATDGGGVNGALATIAAIEYVGEFTYGGRHKDKPTAALRTVFEIDGMDKPWEDHHSLGPSENYEVVDDGDGIRSTNKSKGINRKSGAYFFFESLEAAAEASGVDLDEILPEIDGEGCQSVRPLEGRRVRLVTRAFTNMSGDTKDKAVIGEFVTDEAPVKGKGAKASAKAPKSDDIEEATETAIKEILEDSPTKKGDIGNAIFAANRKEPNVKAMMQQSMRDKWLLSEDRPWTVDKKGVLSLNE